MKKYNLIYSLIILVVIAMIYACPSGVLQAQLYTRWF